MGVRMIPKQVSGWVRNPHMDAVEVQKLSLGVAFTGISPRDVARRVAEFLALKGACESRM